MKSFLVCPIVPCKYEMYVSVLVLVLAAPFCLVLPVGYNDLLMEAGALTIAFLCSLNAVFDYARMNWLERLLAISWFLVLVYYTSTFLWDASQIQAFSPR